MVLNTGLDLSVEHSAGGFRLNLMNGTGVLDILAFGQSKGEIYRQILAANRVIVTVRQYNNNKVLMV